MRPIALPAFPLAVALATVVGVLAGSAPAGAAAEETGEPIVLEPATLAPARRARLEAWWRRLQSAEPVLATVTRHLRRELEAWRGRPTHPGCQRARRALAAVDRDSLTGDVDFRLTLAMARALAELEGAAAACLERRYFEFDYRLQVAEAQLDHARDLARRQLALPRPP